MFEATQHFFDRVAERGLASADITEAYKYGKRFARYGKTNQFIYKGERVTLVVQLVGRTERFLTAYRSN